MEFNTLNLTVTLAIIIVTTIFSIAGFSNQKVIDDLIFYPPAVAKRKQWYRFITCGFVHADVIHLVFNMYVLLMFGRAVENVFQDPRLFGDNGKLMYIVLYVSALVVCLLPTYFKNRDNYYYRSLGASGAVAAIVFVFIFLEPMRNIGLIILPGVGIPAFIFGILYLAITAFLDRKGGGNINHSAHFWGSIYGIVFLIVSCYFLSDYKVLQQFIDKVQEWFAANVSG